MRAFYAGWEICPTPSGKFEAWVKLPPNIRDGNDILPTPSAELEPRDSALTRKKGRRRDFPDSVGQIRIARIQSAQLNPIAAPSIFPLSWSHYVRLMAVEKPHARAFYEAERSGAAGRCGSWIGRSAPSSSSAPRTPSSRRRCWRRGQVPRPEDAVSVQDEIRDPYLLEFLNLKDEYNESDLEEALVRHLEWFLLELGTGFTFITRQKRIRIGDEWYRIDLLLFHRRLRCLMPIDLKIGKFTHADAGQMNLYLNYLRENMIERAKTTRLG